MKKVLAVASVGGHWIQLTRLQPAFEDMDLTFMTTKQSFKEMVPNYKFHVINDANRNNKIKLVKVFFDIFIKIVKIKPDIIITTGAAPGLMAIIAGKLIGVKTIWIDSIANVEELSMSGKIASKIANRVYTQWEDLSNDKIIFKGNIIG
ncbi:glycosyltransferase family protein [Algibacter pacificus]|uniref:oligosaccharide biosynthesis protein Alg14 n=1 Tax=Algibacter pacificus TaxID=2599389 RepID=UPI0011CB5388|nr:oligosaccharide biosynthesis protein Alg14 [Algibacter pacificus]